MIYLRRICLLGNYRKILIKFKIIRPASKVFNINTQVIDMGNYCIKRKINKQ